MTTDHTPPLSEFIDLDTRRKKERQRHGFGALADSATVAVYPTNTAAQYLILAVRFSEDAAVRYRLTEGMRMTVVIHPDQQHLALRVTPDKRKGAALFKPKGSRSLVYQTTLREGMMPTNKAKKATISESEGALVLSLA
jgi:hypothetical protein